MINANECNLLIRLEEYFEEKTAPKTKKDQEKLIKALDIVDKMLKPNNCNHPCRNDCEFCFSSNGY